MPQTQTAQVAVYDFGAPVAVAPVVKFRVRQGGKIDLKFENPGDADLIVNAEVSADDITYAPTTTQNNGQAVTAVGVEKRESKEFTINLREGLDKFVRVTASGGGRGQVQVRNDSILEIVTI